MISKISTNSKPSGVMYFKTGQHSVEIKMSKQPQILLAAIHKIDIHSLVTYFTETCAKKG